jgi:DNA-binding CsgD family transcriptional regulator/tetratricopeptide (TPR) repeat protein
VPNVVRLTSDTLVGRGEELRSSLAVLRSLPDGRPGIVVVSGPAGIGKTRFVTALSDQLRADGVRVMSGACLDLGEGAPPYSALIGAFRSVDPPAVTVLDALTGAIPMRRSRLFELLRTTTDALARRRPTALVIEDLHWSDRITRDAILYLTTMVRGGRLGVVVTFRGQELTMRPAVEEFLDVLHRHTVLRATLDPLSVEDVAAQVAGIAGEPPSREDAERIHRRSAGIPLLVEEVVAAEAAGTTGVPDHLRNLFLARVARLGEAAARAVEVVAVVGGRCTEGLVATVLGSDPAETAAALDRAVTAEVLVLDGPGYRMRHDLLREAVYDGMRPGARRRLHGLVAESLAAVPQPDPTALAHHWYQAGDPVQAVPANLAAAALADRVQAFGGAHAHLERVLELVDTLPVTHASVHGGRAALLARAAEAAYLAGSLERSVELAQACATTAVGSPPETALRWERLARYEFMRGNGAGARQAHQRSLAALSDDAPLATRARVLSGYAWYLGMTNETAAALTWSADALEAAEQCHEPLERCRALLAWGYARAGDRAGLAALRDARDLAVTCDSGDELGRAHAGLDLALRRQGCVAERERVLREGLGFVTAHGRDASYGRALRHLLVELLLDLGRWDEADEILEALETREVGGVPAMFAAAYRARLAAARGRSSVADECARRAVAMWRDLPEMPDAASVALCAWVECGLWEGDLDEAQRRADRAQEITSDPILASEVLALRARIAAEVATRARGRGSRVVAVDVKSGAESLGLGAEGHPQVRAFLRTAQAELSRRDDPRRSTPWREAVVAWEEAADPYREAYCRWRLAEALLRSRSGRAEAARELSRAQRIADSLGASPLQEAIQTSAAAARLRLPHSSRRVPTTLAVAAELGLTPREMEILPLLVAGRTNAEIADAFVISSRTVGVHVSRILHKLGAARRTEAADIARRRGLVSD